MWIKGVGWSLDTAYWTNRDLYYPKYVEYAARMAYEMAGIREPRKEIHVVEPYDPFDYKELHHLEGLLLADKGEAPRLTAEGVTARTGNMPVCPSGGCWVSATHRCCWPDEGGRDLLATARRGGQAPGSGQADHGFGAGVG